MTVQSTTLLLDLLHLHHSVPNLTSSFGTSSSAKTFLSDRLASISAVSGDRKADTAVDALLLLPLLVELLLPPDFLLPGEPRGAGAGIGVVGGRGGEEEGRWEGRDVEGRLACATSCAAGDY